MSRPWRIHVDTGGTFTDCVAVDPDGRVRTAKVLSSSALRARVRAIDGRNLHLEAPWKAAPAFFRGFELRRLGADESAVVEDGPPLRLRDELKGLREGDAIELLSPEEAPVLAARMVTGTAPGSEFPPFEMHLATTRGTNALLERRGARTLLVVTRGFADLLEIGTQQRPELFAREVRKPPPPCDGVMEADERVDARGNVLRALNEEGLVAKLRSHRAQGFEAVAICLLHAHLAPQHEQRVARAAREVGFEFVSVSSEVAPLQGALRRAETTVIDASLSPVLGRYLARVRSSIGDRTLRVMTSAGGLVDATEFRPRDSLLSGPAGGVVGVAAVAREVGRAPVLSFDMGGTSTDVARWDERFDYVFEVQIGDAHLVAPALALETVAAGGGSICRAQRGRLTVGPDSAGAFPGSACYGAGGPLTLTDVNLLLDRFVAENMPIPIDRGAAEARLAELLEDLHAQTGTRSPRDEVLHGLRRIADERMAEAIRRVSVRKGLDPSRHALVVFGGAGAQHACAVADELEVDTVIVPRRAGLLSAVGLAHAVIERFAQSEWLRPVYEDAEALETRLRGLETEALEALGAEGIDAGDTQISRRIAELRYVGQDSTLQLEVEGPVSELATRFEEEYERLFAHRPRGRKVEVVSIRAVASTHPRALAPQTAAERSTLERQGPARIPSDDTMVYVAEGWTARTHASGHLLLQRHEPRARAEPSRVAAVELELFRHRFESIALEMGERLRQTSVSTNIKERLDFSCALLDAEGRLVVNAPHIPVHLGALGLCVRSLRAELELGPGDVAVTNHPAFGGSHLPDVTVVSAVYTDDGERLGYVAARAHHAEIGGKSPGSMPADARDLSEEGVVIPPMFLVRARRADWDRIESVLSDSPYPSRSIADNLADLRAMVAACRRGVEQLQTLAEAEGAARVGHQMDELRALASRQVRAAFARLGAGRHGATEAMDDGSPVVVEVTVSENNARIDFTGSSDVHPGNLNATEAIVHSAVLYALRLLVDEPLPLNEGLLEAVELVLPEGMLHPRFDPDPRKCPAIVGGNVETSQRTVDVLLKAFGVVAGSQGTMNNLSFGDSRFGFYETLGGGTGAGANFDGADAVHSHMTNTRLTDVEVMEHRYPVRVRELGVRRDSGGKGRHRGGNGMVRELEFLAPVHVSLMTQRRSEGPYGLEGGERGRPGRQWVIRADGRREELRATASIRLSAGDRLRIETPGGGGFGKH